MGGSELEGKEGRVFFHYFTLVILRNIFQQNICQLIASDVNNDASTWVLLPYLFSTCTRRARTAWRTSYKEEFSHAALCAACRGWYHGGRRPSSDDNFHSPTVIPPLALDKSSIMKCYHHRRMCSHTSPRRSPKMVTLHDTGLSVK